MIYYSKLLEKHKKLPNINPEIFQIFVEYLYTGNCSFSLSNVSDLLSMCDELKLIGFKKEIFAGLESIKISEIIEAKIDNEEVKKFCEERKTKIPSPPKLDFQFKKPKNIPIAPKFNPHDSISKIVLNPTIIDDLQPFDREPIDIGWGGPKVFKGDWDDYDDDDWE